MNNLLEKLHAYPFERLNQLLEDISAPEDHHFIPLSLGEPKHSPAPFLVELFANKSRIKHSFMSYPPTRGISQLRSAIAKFASRRYDLKSNSLNAEDHVLPVNGSREALFSFAQACISPSQNSCTLMPNPFYQIYEGAALLAGSKPMYLPCLEENNYIPDFENIEPSIWEQTSLVYICTPGNPTGSVMSIDGLQALIRKSDEYNFIIASDECYSEIYSNDDAPPPGILCACAKMDRDDFRNCVAFNSLSKRSNLPGLRSGFVAGDADIISRFLQYRTYHGSAMPLINQEVSIAAWEDEDHVKTNRLKYKEKFSAVIDILSDVLELQNPDGGFYLWPSLPISDEKFTRDLYGEMNVKVLPGSYLSREINGYNPGRNRVRIALVAELDECVQAAGRLKDFLKQKKYYS